METIRLEDIIEELNNGKGLSELDIEISKYLDITMKDIIINGFKENDIKVDGIIDNSLEVSEDGVYYINNINFEMFKVVTIVMHYTNIDLSSSEVFKNDNKYDLLVEYGIYAWIRDNIPYRELELLDNLINSELSERIKTLNSTEAILSRSLKTLLEKIPSERKIKNMLKNVKDFDINKLGKIKDLFEVTKATK